MSMGYSASQSVIIPNDKLGEVIGKSAAVTEASRASAITMFGKIKNNTQKNEDKKMRQAFVECKYRYQAVKEMPWAAVIVKVCG